MRVPCPCLLLLLFFGVSLPAAAEESPVGASELRQAIERAVGLIEHSGRVYRSERQCFSCHHQALPVLALTEVRRRGIPVSEEEYRQQVRHTAAHLTRGLGRYRAGKGQGGRGDTAGYALWALGAADWPGDEVTAAVAAYLLQKDAGSVFWKPPSTTRRPTAGSRFTSTALAVYGLQSYGDGQDADAISQRLAGVQEWLLKASADDTEDRVFRLRALRLINPEHPRIRQAGQELLAEQLSDGGWAQRTDGMPGEATARSDAYATGTVLVVLRESGCLAVSDPPYRRGVRYLLKTQCADGSWHVATRARPIQQYFESGFPHEKDQFISMAATCWCTMALAAAAPDSLAVSSE